MSLMTRVLEVGKDLGEDKKGIDRPDIYASVLEQLRAAIIEMRRKKTSKGVRLLQDSVPQAAINEAVKCGFELSPHPPYSPDLAPLGYHLFPMGVTTGRDAEDVSPRFEIPGGYPPEIAIFKEKFRNIR